VQGTVARVVPRRVVGEERPLYHVYLSLNDPIPPGVFPGMTADAAIIIARHPNVLRLPRALVPTRADCTATVTVWQNGQGQPRTVTVGLRGDAYVEIVDGLVLGDEVIAE
jgi:multidrug efflux pump subunit AcrA (membrane-fusion protein)